MSPGWVRALVVVSSVGWGAVAESPPADVREAVKSHLKANEATVLREFAELLAIPNVASDTANIRKNADHIVRMLEKRGLAARLLDGEGGPPVVYGELETPGAGRTLMIYVHYDGQPVDPAQWTGSPWTPVLRDGPLETGGKEIPLASFAGPTQPEWRLYARSSGDDKAPIVGLLTALDALRSAKIPLSIDLKVFFEGEEEAGSPHLRAVLEKNKDLLKADAWILCDGPVHQTRQMQVFFGARGVTDVEVTVYGPLRPLHSGHYGNWAPNPAVTIAHLVAGLRDTDGRIKIAGFYDDVRPVTESERRAVAAVPPVDAALRSEFALAQTEAEGAPLVERLLLPALNVRGIAAGGVGTKAANAIPSEATASIDFRLVPDQTPARVRERFEAHLKGQGYTVVHETPSLELRRATPRLVKLDWGSGYPAARASMDLPVSKAVVAAIEGALGAPVVKMPTLGGSIPMYLFEEVFRVPVLGVPIANHDDNQHAANENLRLQNLWDGTLVYAGLLTRFGDALDGIGATHGTSPARAVDALIRKQLEQQGRAGVEVGNSTFGFHFDPQSADFTPWVAHLKNQVYRNWVMPQAALLGARGHVDLEFTVEHDGTRSALRVLRSSGTRPLDEAGQRAISASRFLPLPAEYKAPRLTLQVSFFYNETP